MFDTPKPGNVEDIFAGTASDSPAGAPRPQPPMAPLTPRSRVGEAGPAPMPSAAASEAPGVPVASPFPEQGTVSEPVPSGMPAASSAGAPPPMLEAGTSTGKRVILILAIVLLLALAGGAAYWYFRVSRVTRPVSSDAPAQGEPVDTGTPQAPQEQIPAPTATPEPVPTSEPTASPEATPTPPPEPADADHDGLLDVEEAALGTDINSVDTDLDGLFDYEEVKVYGTSPVNADSDADGFADGVEVRNGYNPNGQGALQNVPGQ